MAVDVQGRKHFIPKPYQGHSLNHTKGILPLLKENQFLVPGLDRRAMSDPGKKISCSKASDVATFENVMITYSDLEVSEA